MNARDVFDEVIAAGGKLWIESGKLKVGAPEPLPDALVDDIRAIKLDLLKLLVEPGEMRRRRVLDMLEANPRLRLAVVTSDDGGDSIIVTVGRRDAFGHGYTADFEIERGRYDGVALLELVEKHSGARWPEAQGNA